MKKKVVHFACFLLALLFTLSSSFAETDYSTYSDDELNSIVNNAKAEIISRQINENGLILVSDEYDVKIYFYGFKKSLSDEIQFVVINGTDKTIIVSLKKLYIENWDVLHNGYQCTVDPGKNAVGESDMRWEKCLTSSKEEASKIDVQFTFKDENWNTLYQTEEKTIYIK